MTFYIDFTKRCDCGYGVFDDGCNCFQGYPIVDDKIGSYWIKCFHYPILSKEPKSLSDKLEIIKYDNDQGVFSGEVKTTTYALKEFISKLKEEFEKNDWENNTLDVPENRNLIIDKLAGPKLT